MRKQCQKIFLLLAAVLLLGACEKMVLDDEQGDKADAPNVTISTSLYSIVPFDNTRAPQRIADYCTKLCFVLYQNGAQKTKVLQKVGDADYGQVALRLAEGTYQLLVVAHSGSSNPSLTNPESIKFTNANGFTDTFYYYGDLQVTADKATHNIVLQRATSMVRITITDDIPADVNKIHLYYTGETAVLNAVTGWGGTTNSQQSVYYDVQGMSAPVVLCAYTFLREETGSLDIQITAHGADNLPIAEVELKDVPLKNHMVTEYTGALFSSSLDDAAFDFTAETGWEVYERHSF